MDHKNIFYFYESNKKWDNNHLLTDVITRYTVDGMDYHIAIHDFNAHENVDEYCKPHSHPEENEINIIFSRNDFTIKITMDDQDFVINKSCIVDIPAGMAHSTNVIEGSGVFICIRMPVNPV